MIGVVDSGSTKALLSAKLPPQDLCRGFYGRAQP